MVIFPILTRYNKSLKSYFFLKGMINCMDFVLESSLNALEFNEKLFDIMMGDFPEILPATEAEVSAAQPTQSANPSEPSNPTTTSNNSSNTTQENEKTGNSENNKGAKQNAPNLWDIIKNAIAWLIDNITDCMNKLANKVAYANRTGKQFEKEIANLEKKYKPRFHSPETKCEVENYNYDIEFLNNFKESMKTYHTEISNRTNKLISDYEEFLRNSTSTPSTSNDKKDGNKENIDQFSSKNKDLEDTNIFRKEAIRKAASSLSIATDSLETDSAFLKAVREKFRGAKQTMQLTQAVYTKCRNAIKSYNDLMRDNHNVLQNWQNEAKKNKGVLDRFKRDSKLNAKSSKNFAKIFTNMVKLNNLPVEGVQFYATCYNEFIINARMVCKTCLGG